jgi:hypothetical protein
MNNQCVERVFPQDGRSNPHPCFRKGMVEREGCWYCTQHDPVRVKERQAASSAKYQAEREQKKVQRRKNQAWDAMVEGKCDMVNMTWLGWIATKTSATDSDACHDLGCGARSGGEGGE